MTLYRAIKSWLEQLNSDGDFIPVSTIADEEKYKPMCLVVKNKRRYLGWKRHSYQKTGIRLQDLLLSGGHAAEQDVEESKLFSIGDELNGNGKGCLGGDADLACIQITTRVSTSEVRNVKVKKRNISSKYLSSVHDDGKVDMDHWFIRQSAQFERSLHVITEVIETVEKTQCEESNTIKGSFISKINALLKSIFQIKLQGGRGQKKTIDIPEGCTLAFRVHKIYIGNGYLYISGAEDISDTGSFGAIINTYTEDGKIRKSLRLPRSQPEPSIRFYSDVDEDESKTNGLKRDIEEHCAQLFSFSAHLRGQFLTGFVAIMREDDLLQELKLQLEQALEGLDQFRLKTDLQELQELGKNLQDPNGILITSLAGPVLYFLQALDELTEVQLAHLVDSVKKGILSKQLALVESILDGEKTFTIDAQLLSPFAEEDLNTTGAMIESSGVTLQREGPTLVGTGDKDAFLALEALYVALYILDKIQRAA